MLKLSRWNLWIVLQNIPAVMRVYWKNKKWQGEAHSKMTFNAEKDYSKWHFWKWCKKKLCSSKNSTWKHGKNWQKKPETVFSEHWDLNKGWQHSRQHWFKRNGCISAWTVSCVVALSHSAPNSWWQPWTPRTCNLSWALAIMRRFSRMVRFSNHDEV